MRFTQCQLRELNVCWNSVYRVIFGFNRWESVKSFIHGMGRLNLIHIIMLHRIKFFFHLLHSNDLLFNIFFVYFEEHYMLDDSLRFVFRTLPEAIRGVYEQFAVTVSA